jgi:hypothetical protein
MRALVLLSLLMGCRTLPDVCAEVVDAPCIALEVKGGARVDQIKVSGLQGFKTVPGNDGASPGAAAELGLPVILAIVPPIEFRGDFTLVARGVLGGATVAVGQTSGSITDALHVQATITLGDYTPPAAPQITRLNPPLTCVGKTTSLEIEGTNLRVINGVAPTVEVDSQPLASVGCGVGDGTCPTITASVGPLMQEGTHSVGLVNPPPESIASMSATLHAMPLPDVVSLTTQGGACQGFEIEGANFYSIGGKGATVKINGTVTLLRSVSECTPMMIGDVVVDNCRHIEVFEQLPAGNHRVVVVGAPPLDCESEAFTLPCF